MRRALTVTAFPLLLAACPGGEPAKRVSAPVAPIPEAPAPREDGRLPGIATPTGYRLSFDLDPTKATFTGRATIGMTFPAPTRHVVLHGRDLRITRAVSHHGHDTATATVTTRVARGGQVADELVLTFDRMLEGSRDVLVEYEAPFGNELSGFYRVKDGDRWYVFSQLEATDARRAFPCFDEPSYKVPFDVEIKVPKGMLALANTRETQREDTADGRFTRFAFATTKPLPSYLLAVAVGDLDVKEGTTPSSTRVRLVTTKGKGERSELALDLTAKVLGEIERVLGIPYPYDKLDMVAVPDFAAGAMENPGLVTFREERLLVSKDASFQSRRAQALIVAHELAHQWFGDLVTAAWWTDIWLNEGLATWLQYRVVDALKPTYGAKLDGVAGALFAMEVDALSSARAVRQPVATANDVGAAFDDITYLKGASIVSTVGDYVGDDALLRGLHLYLEENAHKSVTTAALLGALDRASNRDVTRMASSFLDKPGVPEVSGDRSCTRDGWSSELMGEPYRPLGVTAPEGEPPHWTFAVCARAEGKTTPACADLAEGAPSLVAGRGACPTWVHPNASSSYYRFSVGDAELVRLAHAGDALSPAQRMTLVSNAWASVRAGRTRSPVLLKVLAELDADRSRHVIAQLTSVMEGMSDVLVSDDARAKFRAFVTKRLAKRKEALGWTSGAGAASANADDPDLALARLPVLSALGDLAEDEATLREADVLAEKWLEDPASVDADVATVAVDLASRHAGRARFDALRKAAAGGPKERRLVALKALVGFDDPELLDAAMGLVVTGEIRPQELRYVLAPALDRKTSRVRVEAFVRAHWDELRKALPGKLARGLVTVARAACSEREVATMKAFYEPKAAEIGGGAPRRLAESLEAGTLCAALREKDAGALSTALLRWKE